MKKLIILFIVLWALVFISARTNQFIKEQISIGENEVFKPGVSKDSMAILSGGKALLPLGDIEGFMPPALTSFICENDFEYMHIIASQYDTNSGRFTGLNYIFSSDTGQTWSAPEDIIPDSSMIQNYSSITIDPSAGYPYVAFTRDFSIIPGVWFTKDMGGPGGNSWSTPYLISDTVNYFAYAPSIAVNYDGSQVSMLTADGYGIYGLNTSSDYGSSWNGYTIDGNLNANSDIYQINIAKTLWLDGDTLIGLFGAVFNDDTVRQNIVNSNKALSAGYSFSYDGGVSWDTIKPLFDNKTFPDIPSIKGDTLIYYIDTLDNNTVDSLPVKAYPDTVTGLWADETGNIDTMSLGFGTWWYWWDAEYYDGKIHAAIPYTELYIDYYIENNKLYTFPRQGNAIMYVVIDPATGDSMIDYYHLDIHDDSIIDTLGNTVTQLGTPYSCNIAFDEYSNPYIIFLDYLQSDYSSVLRYKAFDLPFGEEPIDTLLIDAGLIGIETCKYIIGDKTHIAGIPLTEDSLYYWSGVSPYSGIGENHKSDKQQSSIKLIRNNNNTFTVAYMAETDGHTSIDIFDITGRKVFNILSAEKEPGSYKAHFSMSSYPAGIYFISINTSVNKSSIKLMYLK